MPKHKTNSEQETRDLARNIAHRLKGGDILLLIGELGAGKTTFVQGLAEAFGIKKKIKSPTFTLIREYAVSGSADEVAYFIHCDAYRIKRARELKESGITDWLDRPDTLTVVEWGEKIKPLLKGRHYTVIRFKYGKNLTERIITTPPNLPGSFDCTQDRL